MQGRDPFGQPCATVVETAPVIVGAAASVAVIGFAPAVFSVAPPAKVCVPPSAVVNVYDAGRTAWASVEVKSTVPR